MSRQPPALFLPDGAETFVPTSAATGAWDREALHGAAVTALLASRLAPRDRTLVSFRIDIVAPVPHAPLQLRLRDGEGGRRVQRQEATLIADGRTVAIGRSVTMRTAELDLPEAARRSESPFDPDDAPPLAAPDDSMEGVIGWPNFHSLAVATRRMRVPEDRAYLYQWVSLVLPAVAGEEISGIETATVAADFGSDSASRVLPWKEWSFKNAELSVHFSRPPTGSWIGMRSDAVIQPVGSGIASTQLFDSSGRLGQSASSLLIEPR